MKKRLFLSKNSIVKKCPLSLNLTTIFVTGFLFLLIIAVIFAPYLAPYDPIEQFRNAVKVPPFCYHEEKLFFLLGTDEVGRDILSRLIYGARSSLLIGFLSVFLAMLPGIFLGFLAAFYSKCSMLIMRFMDVLLALPSILLAAVIVAIFGKGLMSTICAIAIVGLPSYTCLTRIIVQVEMQKDYVMAAHVVGARNFRIMFLHILPNCAAPLIVQATLGISSAMLDAAALGFLGLSGQPPSPEWGTMLASAKDHIVSAWWVITMPGLAILSTVLTINFLGERLRDALDPRLKNSE